MNGLRANRADYHLPFAALMGVAAALRVFLNNVVAYSRADETVYLRYAHALSSDGYAAVLRLYLGDPGMAVFPSPLRWAYIGASSLFCCTHRGLATLSTICGIAAVALTYVLALKLFEQRTATIAAALMATSPLQLAMGRRALSDEFFCALVLASLVALIHDRPLVWAALSTCAFAAKEQFLLIYPVVLAFWWLRERRIRWIWAVPPFLYFAVFCALAGDVDTFFRITRITTSTIGAPYAAQFQSGPPHRLLLDFLAIAPLVTIAFVGAAFAARMPEQRRLLLLAAGILVVQSLLSSKNLRYVIAADPLMRLLIASWLPPGRWWTAALIVNAAIELVLFYVVFIAGGVYDPVTRELLRALKM
jgi:4-amino-4-deoxy-L-arabinose transferase-like glycosyltransferase